MISLDRKYSSSYHDYYYYIDDKPGGAPAALEACKFVGDMWVEDFFLSSPIFCLPRLIGFNLDSKQPLLSKVVVMKDSIFFYITHVGEAAWKKGKISL